MTRNKYNGHLHHRISTPLLPPPNPTRSRPPRSRTCLSNPAATYAKSTRPLAWLEAHLSRLICGGLGGRHGNGIQQSRRGGLRRTWHCRRRLGGGCEAGKHKWRGGRGDMLSRAGGIPCVLHDGRRGTEGVVADGGYRRGSGHDGWSGSDDDTGTSLDNPVAKDAQTRQRIPNAMKAQAT